MMECTQIRRLMLAQIIFTQINQKHPDNPNEKFRKVLFEISELIQNWHGNAKNKLQEIHVE